MALLPALTMSFAYRLLIASLLCSVHHSISVRRLDNVSSTKARDLLPDSKDHD